MSHFTVLVSLSEVTSEALDKALQPFHEYECTGIDDEYVVFVEEDREALEMEYKEHSDDYESFDEFIKDWHGFEFNSEGKIGRYTNPNAKWDWWTIGGRWSGKLLDKSGKSCDQAYKKDIDFEGMKAASVAKNLPLYEEAQSAFDGEVFIKWADILKDESLTIEEKREKYHGQKAIKNFRDKFDNPFASAEDYAMTKDEFIKKQEFSAISTFAILNNGNWLEKGEMGWWACVGNEKEDWEEIFTKALNEIPEDNYLVVIDCHI